MKKTNVALIVSIFMAVIYLFPGVVNASSQIAVSIEGKNIEFNETMGKPFVDENNRTQVPFRATLEAIGAEVKWDEITKTAFAEKDGINVKVPIGQNYIFKDGIKIDNDTKAIIHDGKTFLPIRVVLEAFGYHVGWDGNNSIINVGKGNLEASKKIETITSDSFLDSIAGVWYLKEHHYFIEISKNGTIDGGVPGTEYDYKAKMKSKQYDSITNSLRAELVAEFFEMGYEPERVEQVQVFSKTNQNKLKITHEDGQGYEYEYIAKNLKEANPIMVNRR